MNDLCEGVPVKNHYYGEVILKYSDWEDFGGCMGMLTKECSSSTWFVRSYAKYIVNGWCLVAKCNGEYLGLLMYEPSSEDYIGMEIKCIVVSKVHRRHGVMKLLLTEFLSNHASEHIYSNVLNGLDNSNDARILEGYGFSLVRQGNLYFNKRHSHRCQSCAFADRCDGSCEYDLYWKEAVD